MAKEASGPSAAPGQTAVLVINAGATSLLCPFFDKCDGVLLNAEDGSQEFYPRDRSAARTMSDLLVELRPAKVICGFIGEADRERLVAAGMDVRLGSCSCPVDELIGSFANLPRA